VNGAERWLAYQVAADRAVNAMVHRIDRREFHRRYPSGECPLCSPITNLMEKSGMKAALAQLKKDLGA